MAWPVHLIHPAASCNSHLLGLRTPSSAAAARGTRGNAPDRDYEDFERNRCFVWNSSEAERSFPKVSQTAFRDYPEHDRSDVGFSIVQESVRLRQENLSGAQEGRAAGGEGVQGKGRHVLTPTQHRETRSTKSAPTQVVQMRRSRGALFRATLI